MYLAVYLGSMTENCSSKIQFLDTELVTLIRDPTPLSLDTSTSSDVSISWSRENNIEARSKIFELLLLKNVQRLFDYTSCLIFNMKTCLFYQYINSVFFNFLVSDKLSKTLFTN